MCIHALNRLVLGAYFENDHNAFKFNSFLFLLSDIFSEYFLSPAVSYPLVHTVLCVYEGPQYV